MRVIVVARLPQTRVVYDDRVQKRKYYFEIPAFLQIERGKSRVGNSKSNENKNKNSFVFVFIWCFEFSRSWFSLFNLKKDRNFKIIFPFPYPIIYNPDSACSLFKSKCNRKIVFDIWIALYETSQFTKLSLLCKYAFVY